MLLDGLNADQYELITMRKDVNILDKKIREFKFVSLLLPLFCAKLANPIAKPYRNMGNQNLSRMELRSVSLYESKILIFSASFCKPLQKCQKS